METIIKMYVTLMPAIIAGVLNMIWCKLPILKFLNVPIDNKKKLKDGKRIFGDNKTWKGFIGYIILGCFASIIWGLVCDKCGLNGYNYYYEANSNTIWFNAVVGLLIGLFYALFELPNSFLKRRLDITPGKTIKGKKKILFIILDQADSVFGVCLVVAMFHPMSFIFYIQYVLLGALTHLVINILLYILRLRKNMF